jgi:hypothetical protein
MAHWEQIAARSGPTVVSARPRRPLFVHHEDEDLRVVGRGKQPGAIPLPSTVDVFKDFAASCLSAPAVPPTGAREHH